MTSAELLARLTACELLELVSFYKLEAEQAAEAEKRAVENRGRGA